MSVFHEAISKQLHAKFALKTIYPVYDYFRESGANYYVFYAQVALKKDELHTKKGSLIEWFTFKQMTKLRFLSETRQDIVVAERVINAKARQVFDTLSS